MIDESKIAWMAALYEGEGCVSAPRSRSERGGSYSSGLRLRFKMTDRDVLERFKEYAECGILTGPYKPSGLGKKDTYELSINGSKARALLMLFVPWLGSRRNGQVKFALDKQNSMPPPTKDGVKLNREKAKEIMFRLNSGEQGRSLAREYGVTDAMISRIKLGRAWSCVSI